MLGSSGTEKGGFGKGQWRKHLGNQKEVLDFQDRLEGKDFLGTVGRRKINAGPRVWSVCLSVFLGGGCSDSHLAPLPSAAILLQAS